MNFKLVSPYQPTGDQPQAIELLTGGIKAGMHDQVLLGVTGSGKTYTIANVIQNTQKPTLIISHNKTLAAQLYQEFKEYFPENAVSYFVSYYDYYQPEAYIPQTDTYIAKDADINEEIDRLRLLATSMIFSRKDVIVIASVSCIYNLGSPDAYRNRIIAISQGQTLNRDDFQHNLVALHYERSRLELSRGLFRTRGEAVELYPSYSDEVIRVTFSGNKVNEITTRPVMEGDEKELKNTFIYPAKHFLADKEVIDNAFKQIRNDLRIRLDGLKTQGKIVEASRLEQKVNYDLEMIKEVGYVNGIENYSRYFDGRLPGDPPFTLIDYFYHQYENDFLMVIDESHMSIPQIRGMERGDHSRKQTLIDFGFRLPSAIDNRPMNFREFLSRQPQTIYVSATPSEWETTRAQESVHNTKYLIRDTKYFGIAEQLIRPTGLVDPVVEVRPAKGQIQDLIKEILSRKKFGQRVLVTTLTKKTAEELSDYLADTANTRETILVNYLHADVDTLDRSDILADLRFGKYDVIVGINLLREGLDLPEVSLVAILDADKQGFLRSKVALIQTMGRAARNSAGIVILYADEESVAMREAIAETGRRRLVQLEYNQGHGITPETIIKPIRSRIIEKIEEVDETKKSLGSLESLTPGDAKILVMQLKRQMKQYAKLLDFEHAARTRDKMELVKEKFGFNY